MLIANAKDPQATREEVEPALLALLDGLRAGQDDLAELAAGGEALVGRSASSAGRSPPTGTLQRRRSRTAEAPRAPPARIGDGLLLERPRPAGSSRGCGRACPSARAGSARPWRPRPRRSPRSGRRWPARRGWPGCWARPPARARRRTARGPRTRRERHRGGAERARPAGAASSRRTVATTDAPAARPSCTAGRAHASGAAVHEQALPRAQPRLGEEGVVRGGEHLGHAAGLRASRAPSGTGMAARSCTTASSAWPPPPTTAMTRSPVSKRVAPRRGPPPRRPARGRGCPAGTPGGAGYAPLRCSMSAPLMPAARTRTSTSPFPGSGSGRSSTTRRPSWIVTARTGGKYAGSGARPVTDRAAILR